MKRIAIIGNAGSGKSVLAKKLQSIFNLPVYHLDQYFWKPGWVHPDIAEYKLIHDSLCNKDEWIIEGMNLKVAAHRLDRADMIIYLAIPRSLCIWRIFKRTWQYYGIETPSSAAGCVERFNLEFLKFLLWVWNYEKKYHSMISLMLSHCAKEKEIHILNSPKEVDNFIKQLVRKLRPTAQR